MAKEIRITNVNENVHEQLNNVAQNLGITLTAFLKPKLRKILDEYPEEMKKPVKD